MIYDLRHCYKLDNGSERYENGAGSAPLSTGLVDDHRPCSAKSIQTSQTLRKERGSKRPLDNDLGRRADARQPKKVRSLNVSILPLLRCSVISYHRSYYCTTSYKSRRKEQGVDEKYTAVHRVSPALDAAPTRSTHGLHATHTSRQCLQGSLLKKTHQPFTRRARQIKASGSFVVRKLAMRHALATVASSPYQISHIFEAPTQASKR